MDTLYTAKASTHTDIEYQFIKAGYRIITRITDHSDTRMDKFILSIGEDFTVIVNYRCYMPFGTCTSIQSDNQVFVNNMASRLGGLLVYDNDTMQLYSAPVSYFEEEK